MIMHDELRQEQPTLKRAVDGIFDSVEFLDGAQWSQPFAASRVSRAIQSACDAIAYGKDCKAADLAALLQHIAETLYEGT